MKKIISLLLLSLSVSTLYATPCPPLAVVAAHTTFNRAISLEDNDWGLIDTRTYQFNNTTWITGFAVRLANANTPEEAVKLGQTFFDEKVHLTEPMLVNGVCMYALDKNYIVISGLEKNYPGKLAIKH